MKRAKKSAASGAVDLMTLADCVERFAAQTVVLFGDFVADVYEYGEISRVSREAPVLIVRHRETHLFPGGGANAANNFAALGARVFPVTAVGDDAAGAALIEYFREKRVSISGVLKVKGWTTPTKTRILAGWAHTVGQQVLRVDREPSAELPEGARRKLLANLRSKVRGANALAISDYGFGVAKPEVVREATVRLKNRVPVTLDARHNLHAYAKAGVTSATPNEAELEAVHHRSIGQNVEELRRCGMATLDQMRLRALLVTRGRDGMALFEPDGAWTQIAIHGSNQAVDVTGAGDTVLAAFTLGLTCGASALEAAHIANIAGGLVVMKRGTAIVSREELLGAIRHEAAGAAG